MPETIIPPLPAVPNSADAPMRKWMGAVKEMLEVWAARRGDLLDQVVTYRDLLAVDMVNVSSRYPRLDSSGMTVGAVTQDVTIPPVVTGIVATGGYRNIFIEWDATTYSNRAYSEVLRSSVDVVGDAVVIGQTTGTLYVDAVGNSATYFYWVRNVSRSGIEGQMQTNGVSASTVADVEYMLDVLTGELTESQLYADLNSRIDLIDGPSIDPGTVNFRLDQFNTALELRDVDFSNTERRERVSQVESNAEATLRAVLAVHDARLDAADTVAIAERELRQDIVDGVSAEASERLTLAAKLDTDMGMTVALIVDEATTRATADTAEATARELLRATLESADTDVIALVSTEAAARVSGDSAEAYQRSLLQASLESDDDVLTARIYTEETTRATADTALAQQITLLSAGAGEQFDWQTIWYFDAGIESWGGNGTPTASNGFLRAANQASSAYVTSPTSMATDAAKYGQMRLRARKTGTVTFSGWLWWREAADATWETSRRIALDEPTWDANDIGLITVTPEWTGTIDRIRIDLSDAQTATDYMELDWVAVGRPSPGASSAQLLVEQTARIDGDTAIAEDVTELHAQVNHVTTGLPAAHAAVVTEASARASADSALTTSFSTLNAQVNHATTGLPAAFAAVEDEATARASAIDAEAATRVLLAARVTDAETDIVTSAAAIVTEQTARADEDTALSNSITALQAVVTDAETDIIQTQADLQSEQTVRATADNANATDVRRLRAKTEYADETLLRNLLIGEAIRAHATGTLALARQELKTDIVDGLSAEASARLVLEAMVDTNAAAIVSEQTARVDADSAMASDFTALAAVVADPETGLSKTRADLQVEQTARATDTDAAATAVRSLRAANANADETALRNLLIGEGAREQFIGSIALARQEISADIVDGLSAEASARLDLQAVVNENAAYVVDNVYTKIDADSAIAGQITEFKTNTLEAEYTNTADLVVNYYTKTDADGAIASSATTLRAYADIGVKTFVMSTEPNARGVSEGVVIPLEHGDIWVDTDDNRRYVWNVGLFISEWIPASDTADFDDWVAVTYSSDIQGLEDGKIESFFQDADPATGWTTEEKIVHIGDIWYSSTSKLLKRWSGSAWTTIEDQTAINAANAASAAQSTADGKIVTFAQTTAPTTSATGDLWIDTDDSNAMYRWSGSSWVLVRDTSQAGAFATWLTGTYDEDIQGLEDGKIESFFQDVDPSDAWLETHASHAGDIWYSSDTKRLKRWSGTAWANIEDQVAIDAADAASLAQDTADGKITTYTSAGIPTPTVPTTTAVLGDLCFDTNDGNKLYRWGGLSWQPVRDEAISDVDARVTTVETTKIGYCTVAGAATDDTTKTTCEAAGGTWHVGLPMATAVKQVSVSDGVNTAALEIVMSSHKTTLGTIESEYIVKIDNNGVMSGFGLFSELTGSKFIASVDQFAVAAPLSSVTAWAGTTAYTVGATRKVGAVVARLLVCKTAGTSSASTPTLDDSTTIGNLITDGSVIWQVASSVPFVVQTTGSTVEGVPVPSGIYLDAAYIVNSTITNAALANLAVDDAKIANLSVGKLTAGSISVGEYIQSSNYSAGSSGWRIHGDGTAELSTAIVRGTVYATDGEFNGTVYATDGEFSGVVTTDGVTTKTVMDGGNVTTYLKVGGSEIPYQSLNHVESGVATNNTQVTIPGYFKNTPKVLVSPFDLSVYKAANAAQDQKLVCTVTNLIQDPADSYIWKFTPTATLSLTAATSVTTVNTAASDGDLNDAWTSSTYTTAANTTAITASSTMTSVKTTGVSNTYYYRSITATLYYRVAGSGGSWLTGATSTLAMGASITNALSPTLTKSSLSAASYEFYIGYSAFNTDGTSFTSGTPVYDYATTESTTVSGTVSSSGDTQTSTFTTSASVPSGYTVYDVDYTADVSVTIVSPSGLGCSDPQTSISSGSQLAAYFTSGSYSYSKSESSYDTSNFYLTARAGSCIGSTWSGSASITISNAKATIYSRKLQSSTAYSNSSYLTSYTATLSASSSLATGTLNWIAIGA